MNDAATTLMTEYELKQRARWIVEENELDGLYVDQFEDDMINDRNGEQK